MTQIDPSATPTNQPGSRPSKMDLNSASLISNAAFFSLTGAALIASIIVFLVARASERAKDRELVAYQATATRDIANANAETKRASESAARANERAALLEKEAATSRVEQGRLALALQEAQNEIVRTQRSVARHVSEQQADMLRTALSGQGIHIRLLYEGSQPEAGTFAQELETALKRAGVIIDEVAPNTAIGNIGLEVYGGDDTEISTKIAETLLRAFGQPVIFTQNVGSVIAIRVATKPSSL